MTNTRAPPWPTAPSPCAANACNHPQRLASHLAPHRTASPRLATPHRIMYCGLYGRQDSGCEILSEKKIEAAEIDANGTANTAAAAITAATTTTATATAAAATTAIAARRRQHCHRRHHHCRRHHRRRCDSPPTTYSTHHSPPTTHRRPSTPRHDRRSLRHPRGAGDEDRPPQPECR